MDVAMQQNKPQNEYGSSFFHLMSEELSRSLPGVKGLPPKNLRYAEKFFVLYSDEIKNFPQAVGELFSIPWGHHRNSEITLDGLSVVAEVVHVWGLYHAGGPQSFQRCANERMRIIGRNQCISERFVNFKPRILCYLLRDICAKISAKVFHRFEKIRFNWRKKLFNPSFGL